MSKGTTDKLSDYPKLYASIVVLFFIWGFITLMNDLLVPIFKAHFQLNYTKALLVQFVFFASYFVFALPMASLVNILHYRKSIVIGLCIIAAGALAFIPAHYVSNYYLFLLALFILAAGVVMLQVAANPLATLLGSKNTASARLTLAQGINSLGYVLGPIVVAGIISDSTLNMIYTVMACFALLAAWFIATRNFQVACLQMENAPETQVDSSEGSSHYALWQSTGFMLAVLGIFFYVGAEVSAGSLLVSFAGLPDILNLSIKHASFYLSFFWGLAMAGRFLGSYLLIYMKDSLVLAIAAICNVLLILVLVLDSGAVALYALVGLGFFNSIMFPVIFSIGLSHFNDEAQKERASGYMVMAIVGGAFLPIVVGMLADHIGLQRSFLLLLLSYLFICGFGFYVLTQRKALRK